MMADDKAPEDMTDAELAAKVNPEAEAPVEEAPADPASPKEESKEPKEEPKKESPVEEAVAPAEEEQEEAPAPSRREQLRVQDLLNKYGPPPTSQPTTQPASQSKAPNYQELIDADPEVYKQLDQATTQFGQEQFTQGQNESLKQVQTVKWETLLNMDAPQMETKYSVLDKESPDFHPAVSDALSRRYLQMVGYDSETGLVERPNIRWKDFIEGEFELADEIASTKNQETVKNVAKQAAATGLRPDGSSAKRLNLNQAPEDMSLEELYASIGQTPPKK